MRVNIWALLLAGLLSATPGCDALEKATGVTYTEPAATSWPASVTALSDNAAIDADVGEGSVIDLEWADQASVGCWVGTEHTNFGGPHVFYSIVLPELSTLDVTVTPAADVDVSVYLLGAGTGQFQVPPNVETATDCDASCDAPNNSNPGVTEAASLSTSSTPYNVLIGVAGADGHTSGAFALDVQITAN